MNNVVIKYPHIDRKNLTLYRLRLIIKWFLIISAFVCPIVNYFLKGPLWSPIAIWAIVFIWKVFLSPDILEFSILTSLFRLSFFSIILITLIGVLLSPGWLGFVLPIIGFGTLALSAIFFLINLSKHKTDAMPLIWEILVALIIFIIVRYATGSLNWPMLVLGNMAIFFAIMGAIAFHRFLWGEIKKRLHTR